MQIYNPKFINQQQLIINLRFKNRYSTTLMKIVLLGYMSSGKSSVGRLLAEQLGLEFIDLDEAIEAHAGMRIPEIFADKGEIYFRKMEMVVLRDVLENTADVVLSLGGGTPCYGNNMQLISANTGHSFYLKLSIGNLVKRIAADSGDRPLVAGISEPELPEFIGKHLFERAPFYAMAKYTVDCNDKTVAQISEEIQQQLF